MDRGSDRRTGDPGRIAHHAIAAGIIERTTGLRLDFLTWASFGVPLVLVAIPLCWFILMRVQKVAPGDFDAGQALAAIGEAGPWTSA